MPFINIQHGEIDLEQQITMTLQPFNITFQAYVYPGRSAVLSLGLLCHQFGVTFDWDAQNLPTLRRQNIAVQCSVHNDVPILVICSHICDYGLVIQAVSRRSEEEHDNADGRRNEDHDVSTCAHTYIPVMFPNPTDDKG